MAYDRHSGIKKKSKKQQPQPKGRQQEEQQLSQNQQLQSRVQEQPEAPPVSSLDNCPGAGNSCNYDGEHRVCAQLLDPEGKPLNWGSGGNFWQATDLGTFMWDNAIRENGGDSWCIDLWQTAKLIQKVGCENVHVRCEATDVNYVLENYWGKDDEESLAAWECLAEGCQLTSALIDSSRDAGVWNSVLRSTAVGAAGGALIALAGVVLAACSRRAFSLSASEPLLL
jgi:hypothetical protein